jgi:hypothetical protein
MKIETKKIRVSIWDFYEMKIKEYLKLGISVKAIYKLITSEMSLENKPGYDSLYK